MKFALFLALLALPAHAQDGIRGSDRILTSAQLNDLIGGQMLEFFDGSKSRYGTDGAYIYTYTDDGPEWKGIFQTFENSEVCIQFDNGSNRCDYIVQDGERIVLVTADGLRFPVRNRSVYPR